MLNQAGVLRLADETGLPRGYDDRLCRFAEAIAAMERAYSVSAVSYETGAACARFIRARSKA